MKYFLIIIMFIFISCGTEEEEIRTDPRFVDQCQEHIDCENGEYKMDFCHEVKSNEENTQRKECTFYNCFGWNGVTGNGKPIYNYYKSLDDTCNKEILVKAKDN